MSRITRSGFAPFNLRTVFSAAGLEPPIITWRGLRQWIFDSYRPESHYMRGPGPKWREKHAYVTSVLSISRRR